MKQLMTKWADNINEKNVLGEYPRPLMRRKSYVNLNGIWKYAIRETKGFQRKWMGISWFRFRRKLYCRG